jgi:hypothetical protein
MSSFLMGSYTGSRFEDELVDGDEYEFADDLWLFEFL